MDHSLLISTKNLNQKLKDISSGPISCMRITDVIAQQLGCNAYLIGNRGNLLGYSFQYQPGCEKIFEVQRYILKLNNYIANKLYNIRSTQVCKITPKGSCMFCHRTDLCSIGITTSVIIPVNIGGQREGTLILGKKEGSFSEEEIFTAKAYIDAFYKQIKRFMTQLNTAETKRKAEVVMALAALSSSQLIAVEAIVLSLNGKEGFVVNTHIAKQIGISPSTIVSAIRKLKSADLVQTFSLGRKGIYFKVLNDYFIYYIYKKIFPSLAEKQ